MSRTNPIVERIRARRHELDNLITAALAELAGMQSEAAMLDKLVAPAAAPAPKPERKPRQSRKIGVTAHTRQIGAVDPGPTLPIPQAAE